MKDKSLIEFVCRQLSAKREADPYDWKKYQAIVEDVIDALDKAKGISQSGNTCAVCDGRGVIPQDGKVVTCPACNGTGKEKQQ